MHDDVLKVMKENLDRYRLRMVGLIPFNMTHEECIHLVAPKAHIPMLCEAAQYADINAAEDWMTVGVPDKVDGEAAVQVALQMRTHAHKQPPLRPRSPVWQPPQTSPYTYAGGEKVTKWLEQRLVLGRRFGLASYTLHELSMICETGAQIRYLWPAVMHLTKHLKDYSMDRTEKWVEKFGAYKAQRHTPAISKGLKEAIQDSSALLTSCVLMGDDVAPGVHGEVMIDCWALPAFIHANEYRARK